MEIVSELSESYILSVMLQLIIVSNSHNDHEYNWQLTTKILVIDIFV